MTLLVVSQADHTDKGLVGQGSKLVILGVSAGLHSKEDALGFLQWSLGLKGKLRVRHGVQGTNHNSPLSIVSNGLTEKGLVGQCRRNLTKQVQRKCWHKCS